MNVIIKLFLLFVIVFVAFTGPALIVVIWEKVINVVNFTRPYVFCWWMFGRDRYFVYVLCAPFHPYLRVHRMLKPLGCISLYWQLLYCTTRTRSIGPVSCIILIYFMEIYWYFISNLSQFIWASRCLVVCVCLCAVNGHSRLSSLFSSFFSICYHTMS